MPEKQVKQGNTQLQREEFTFHPGTNGGTTSQISTYKVITGSTTTDTVSYAYGDATWKDLRCQLFQVL